MTSGQGAAVRSGQSAGVHIPKAQMRTLHLFVFRSRVFAGRTHAIKSQVCLNRPQSRCVRERALVEVLRRHARGRAEAVHARAGAHLACLYVHFISCHNERVIDTLYHIKMCMQCQKMIKSCQNVLIAWSEKKSIVHSESTSC